MNLFNIKDPSFLKDLSLKELEALALEIRAFLIDSIEKSNSHRDNGKI